MLLCIGVALLTNCHDLLTRLGMFALQVADLVGFTAWSSEREPAQVRKRFRQNATFASIHHHSNLKRTLLSAFYSGIYTIGSAVQ